MIHRYVDLGTNPPQQPKSVSTTLMQNGSFNIEDYAKSFINGMGLTQRLRFRKMLENGIKCGMSVATSYGVDYEEFIKEVKKQMGVN